MTNKEIFIETVEALFSHSTNSIPEAAFNYLEYLKSIVEKEKPQFTENGAKVLRWMQENYAQYNNIMKAKEIGEGLFTTSRSVSGAMRKLITDGYATKIDGQPICYSLTDLGKTCFIPEPEQMVEED